MVVSLQTSVKAVVDISNRVLYFSEDQSFPGPVMAKMLRVDNAHLGTLRIGKVWGPAIFMRAKNLLWVPSY